MHNIRIERLWYDVTQGLGAKWKMFFTMLEMERGLNINNDYHIWLLHYLFLDMLNTELQEWGQAWNSHKIRLKRERQASPLELFQIGVMTHGLFSPGASIAVGAEFPDGEAVDDYGIDWEAWEDATLRNHHIAENQLMEDEASLDNPGVVLAQEVVVPDTTAPFDAPGEVNLHNHLVTQFGDWQGIQSMVERRLLWDVALNFIS